MLRRALAAAVIAAIWPIVWVIGQWDAMVFDDQDEDDDEEDDETPVESDDDE